MNCSSMPWYEYTGKAMWIPAFQGSGSDMLRTLVEAITGVGGHGVYGSKQIRCFRNPTATCKTHWPMYPDTYPPNDYRNMTTKRVAMLIRNPMNSLPSSFNFRWERDHRIMDHTVQAPEEEWNKWRDERALHLFWKYWVGQIMTWKNLSYYEVAFYLPYERLVDIWTGPTVLSRLAAELRSNGVRVAPEDDIPCLWYKVVKEQKASRKTKRAHHKYVPSFTVDQKHNILFDLQKLKEEYADDLELVKILSMYHDDIQSNMRIQNDDDDDDETRPPLVKRTTS